MDDSGMDWHPTTPPTRSRSVYPEKYVPGGWVDTPRVPTPRFAKREPEITAILGPAKRLCRGFWHVTTVLTTVAAYAAEPAYAIARRVRSRQARQTGRQAVNARVAGARRQYPPLSESPFNRVLAARDLNRTSTEDRNNNTIVVTDEFNRNSNRNNSTTTLHVPGSFERVRVTEESPRTGPFQRRFPKRTLVHSRSAATELDRKKSLNQSNDTADGEHAQDGPEKTLNQNDTADAEEPADRRKKSLARARRSLNNSAVAEKPVPLDQKKILARTQRPQSAQSSPVTSTQPILQKRKSEEALLDDEDHKHKSNRSEKSRTPSVAEEVAEEVLRDFNEVGNPDPTTPCPVRTSPPLKGGVFSKQPILNPTRLPLTTRAVFTPEKVSYSSPKPFVKFSTPYPKLRPVEISPSTTTPSDINLSAEAQIQADLSNAMSSSEDSEDEVINKQPTPKHSSSPQVKDEMSHNKPMQHDQSDTKPTPKQSLSPNAGGGPTTKSEAQDISDAPKILTPPKVKVQQTPASSRSIKSDHTAISSTYQSPPQHTPEQTIQELKSDYTAISSTYQSPPQPSPEQPLEGIKSDHRAISSPYGSTPQHTPKETIKEEDTPRQSSTAAEPVKVEDPFTEQHTNKDTIMGESTPSQKTSEESTKNENTPTQHTPAETLKEEDTPQQPDTVAESVKAVAKPLTEQPITISSLLSSPPSSLLSSPPEIDELNSPFRDLDIGTRRDSIQDQGTAKASPHSVEKSTRVTRATARKAEEAHEALLYEIAPLTSEIEKTVITAVKNGHGKYPATSLARVVPLGATGGTNNWLNDDVIDGYLQLVAAHGRRNDPTSIPSHHTFTPFFYTKLSTEGPDSVKRWSKRAKVGGKDLLASTKIFIPINAGSHWTLCVVLPKAKKITHYNSMRGSGRHQVGLVRDWVKYELGPLFEEGEWELEERGESPQQTNMDDCGVFAITSARQIMLGLTPMSYKASQIVVQRKRIVAELVAGKLLKRE